MLPILRPNRLSDDTAVAILDLIQNDHLEIGDAIPGQRDLAERFNVSRTSIREGIRYLEALGVLETRSGLGTYVVGVSPTTTVETSLDSWLRDHKEAIIDIIEVREAIEVKAVALAIARGSRDLADQLCAAVQAMEEATAADDLETLIRHDIVFHELIHNVAGNSFLSMLVDSINRVIEANRRAIFAVPGQSSKSIQDHWAIVEAIRARDTERARQAMSRHLLDVKAKMQQLQ
jgi:GntR family transcriptional repressor for pyruvate dehydrogenase complex